MHGNWAGYGRERRKLWFHTPARRAACASRASQLLFLEVSEDWLPALILLHLDSNLLGDRGQWGISYLCQVFLDIRGQLVWRNSPFHFRLKRCVPEEVSFQCPPVWSFPSYSIFYAFFGGEWGGQYFDFLTCPFPDSTASALPDPFPIFTWLISVLI